MANNWQSYTWEEIVSLEYGKALRGYANAKGDVRVFGSNGPVGWTDKALWNGPGVILGRKGAYRGVEFSPEPFYVIDTAYYLVPKIELDMRWLYYAVIYHRLGEIDDGSPIPSTTRAAVYVRELDVPDIHEQQEIASVLAALDDKIELNRQTNETLEGMAQAIFRDWFVDFGPTRRKAAGEANPVAIMGGLTPDPARAAELAALFPAVFGDDGLPVGWVTQPLDTIATFTKGRSYKSSELQPSTVALVTLKSFARGGGYRHDGLKPYSGTFKSEQIINPGDIVLSQTDVTQAADIIGRPAIVSDKGEYTTLVASLDVAIIRAKEPNEVPREYLFQLLNSRQFTEHALAHTSGTTVLHLAKTALPTYKAVKPLNKLPQFYDDICGLFRQKIHCNDLENRTLAETRDYLLPRLMSGAVRIAPKVEAA